MKRLSALWANDKLFESSRIVGNPDRQVGSITFDSRRCTEQSIFVAQNGLHIDGHLFIDEAIHNGSCVIVHSETLSSYRDDTTYIQNPQPAAVASRLAHELYGPYPRHIIAVTGTDGKSTTCEFLYRILKASNVRCALLSTISMDDGSGHRDSPFRQSTPEVEYLYPFLHRCYENNVDMVVLETTSHALSHKTSRTASLRFSGAVITNITSEHLDFHQTVEHYVNDKLNVVRQLKPEAPLVISGDFSYKDHPVIRSFPPDRIRTFAMDESDTSSCSYAETIAVDIESRRLRMRTKGMKAIMNFSFAPPVYTLNLLAAVSMAESLGQVSVGEMDIEKAVNKPVAGRFHLIDRLENAPIIIDFAHTENSFESLFSFIRTALPSMRIVALFGCAGERDTSKRKPMGRIAGRYCHRIYLADEDPRCEDPVQILHQIQEGIESASRAVVRIIADRPAAVATAVEELSPGEVLLLLGKGHEKSIEYCRKSVRYDEFDCVQKALEGKMAL
ncbi:MAG: Mur ligase family protein [Sphaerochaetaceae bacterium]